MTNDIRQSRVLNRARASSGAVTSVRTSGKKKKRPPTLPERPEDEKELEKRAVALKYGIDLEADRRRWAPACVACSSGPAFGFILT